MLNLKNIISIFCLLGMLAFFSNSAFAQTGIEGRMDVRSKKQKGKNKIKYKWHEGEAILKSDLPIKGKFKYQPVKDDVPYWIFISSEKPNAEKKLIDITLFKQLVLAGAEPYVTDSPDSTHFQWVEEYDNLMRRVKKGAIELYDNSKIIDEKYKYVDGYYLVGIREEFGSRKLNTVKDLKVLMTDRPYFMESAELSGRIESRDLRVVAYLVDLFNMQNPMEMLQWETVSYTTTKGKQRNGKGYIQPVDLRNEYNTSSKALLHFWDGEKLEIIESRSLKNLKVGGKNFEEGYFSVTDKTFLGQKWTYEGRTFLVANSILNNNSYYFVPRVGEETQGLIVLEQRVGAYLKPSDELRLRQIFAKQNNF